MTFKNKKIERVVLIVPPSEYTPTSGWSEVAYAPLEGVSIAGTLLHEAGIYVEAHDLRYKSYTLNDLLGGLRPSDCLCLAAQPECYQQIKNLAIAVRKETMCGPIIAGGPLSTSAYNVLLKCASIDYCIVGECENTLVPLITSLRSGDTPPFGVAWRSCDDAIQFNPQKRITEECLNEQSTPDFGFCFSNADSCQPHKFPRTVCYSTSRGCPNDCAFCANLLGHKVVFAGEQKLLNDFHAMHMAGTKYLWINDPTFNVNERHCQNVCDIVAEHRFQWTCTIRATNLSTNLLHTMRKSGCVAVFLGVEILDQQVLNIHNKGITVNNIHNTVTSCLSENLPVVGFLLLDLPGETVTSLDKTLDFVRKHKMIPRAKFVAPYLGSRLSDYYKARHPNMTDEDLLFRLSEVTNGPEDNLFFALSDISKNIMLQYMKEFRQIERERTSELLFNGSHNERKLGFFSE